MEQELSNELFICGGCNAKIGPGVLGDLLSQFPKQQHPDFLVGFDSSDDAAVFRIEDQTAMIQTLDFFPAMVADATLFGEIAAANALSDVFAMGGEVLTAMNIVCWPETKNTDILGKILAGGFRKVQEAGGVRWSAGIRSTIPSQNTACRCWDGSTRIGSTGMTLAFRAMSSC